MKITICGSMTASREMLNLEAKLSSLGHEVILPAFTKEYAELPSLDEMHKESAQNKIDHDLIKGYFNEIKESDAILVVNLEKNGQKNYVGGNTFLEVGFAHVLDKKIFFLNPAPEDSPYLDEIKAMRPEIINGDLSRIK